MQKESGHFWDVRPARIGAFLTEEKRHSGPPPGPRKLLDPCARCAVVGIRIGAARYMSSEMQVRIRDAELGDAAALAELMCELGYDTTPTEMGLTDEAHGIQ